MDKLRDAHKLSNYASPSSRFSSVLDMGQLLLSSSIFNDPSLRSTLQQDFIDNVVLQNIYKTTLPEVDRVNKLFATPRYSPSSTGVISKISTQPARIPQEDYDFAVKNNMCVRFAQGRCKDVCPQNRIHENISDVRTRSKIQNPSSSPSGVSTSDKIKKEKD